MTNEHGVQVTGGKEDRVAALEGDAKVFWVANGTTALCVALRAAGCSGRYVAVQPNVCPHVIASIIASSNRPFFVDIEADRLGLDPVALGKVLPEVGAVVAIHSYGIPCRIAEIREVTSAAGVALLEDCAQAEGATIGGREVGSFGDFAVFSYGEGKIVAAGGGGALIVRRSDFALDARREIENLPQRATTTTSHRLSDLFKQAYNQHYPVVPPALRAQFQRELAALAPALVSQAAPDTERRCSIAQHILHNTVNARRHKHEIYVQEIGQAEGIKIPSLREGAVPWRFNLFLEPTRRNRIFHALLERGIHASTWYPNISRFLAPDSFRTESVHVANWLDERIVNLWLDDRTSEEDVRRTAQTVRSLAVS